MANINYMPFFPNLGSTEWIIIGLVLLVLFGSKKLTELARGLGESGKEIKKAKKEFQTAFEDKEPKEKEQTKKEE